MDQTPPSLARRIRPLTLGLVAGLILTAIPLSALSAPLANPEPSTLRALAADADRRIGAAVQLRDLADPQVIPTVTREFSSITPMNELKWSSLQPQEGVFNFAPADALVSLADGHDMEVVGHTLTWKDSNPRYVKQAAGDPARLSQLHHDHIKAVVGHFKGRVDYWDVVNEPLDNNGRLFPSFWAIALGRSYIDNALRWAHQADPEAKLFINEYRTEGFDRPKAHGLYRLANELLADGLPLHAVGFQFHVKPQQLPPRAEIVANLQRFADLGLDILITELDLRVPTPPSAHDLEWQAQAYRRTMAACLEVTRCRSVTTWGFTDRHSWSESHYPDEGASLLFDKAMREKPAYFGIGQPLGLRAPEAADRQAEHARERLGGSAVAGAWRMPPGALVGDSFPLRRGGAHVITFTAKRATAAAPPSAVRVEVDGTPITTVQVTSLVPTAHHVVVPLPKGRRGVALRNLRGGTVDIDRLGIGGSVPAKKFEHRSGGRLDGSAWRMDGAAVVRNPVLAAATGLSTLHVRAKLAQPSTAAQALRVGLDSVAIGSIPVSSTQWQWYRVPFASAGGRAELELAIVDGAGSPVLVDRIAVSPG